MIQPKVLPRILKKMTTGGIEVTILMNYKGEEMSYFADEKVMSEGFLGGSNIKEDISFVGAMVSNLFSFYNREGPKLGKPSKSFSEEEKEEEEGESGDDSGETESSSSGEEEEEGEDEGEEEEGEDRKENGMGDLSPISPPQEEEDLEFIILDFETEDFRKKPKKKRRGRGGGRRGGHSDDKGKSKKKYIVVYKISEKILLCSVCSNEEEDSNLAIVLKKIQLICGKLKKQFEEHNISDFIQ